MDGNFVKLTPDLATIVKSFLSGFRQPKAKTNTKDFDV